MMDQITGYTPAALYARVSSDRQDVDLSVAAQLGALRDYARKKRLRRGPRVRGRGRERPHRRPAQDTEQRCPGKRARAEPAVALHALPVVLCRVLAGSATPSALRRPEVDCASSAAELQTPPQFTDRQAKRYPKATVSSLVFFDPAFAYGIREYCLISIRFFNARVSADLRASSQNRTPILALAIDLIQSISGRISSRASSSLPASSRSSLALLNRLSTISCMAAPPHRIGPAYLGGPSDPTT